MRKMDFSVKQNIPVKYLILVDNMEGLFHRTFRPILIFSQVCGLMPMRGILDNNPKNLRFTWTNPIHIYQLGVSSVTLFFDIAFTNENLKRKFSIDSFASTVFYTVCLLTTILFLRLGLQFPQIARDFLEIEKAMNIYEKPKRLHLQVYLYLLIFVLLAVVEHGTMGVLHFQRALDVTENGTGNVGHEFYMMHFPSVSYIVPYSWFITVIFTWVNAICTFNWNFLDFFLVGISFQLISKFNQITNIIVTSHSDLDKYTLWEKIFKDYGRIVRLTQKIDRLLSGIILTSFFSNLYHLSLQLLRSMRITGTLLHRLYFYFSLSYLILRLLTTLFCLANVYEAGKKPKDLLFHLDKHNTASLRLLQQILTDDIYFTGNRAFIINISFVFSIIGTIITYQVVLLQFNLLTFVDAE